MRATGTAATRGWPLLGKELVEQAARKRTYALRVAYAVALFVAFVVYLREGAVPRWGSAAWTLGLGRRLFEFLFLAEVAGICVFLPAMMCGVIAIEKERKGLDLLLLTTLGPWQIILQKFWSRLIPMFTILLAGMPLLAVTTSLGGVTATQMGISVYALVLTCVIVGAIALMFSAALHTAAGAFLATYLAGGVFCLAAMLPVYGYLEQSGESFGSAVVASLPALLLAGVALVLTRVYLVRRSRVPERSLLLERFRETDDYFERWNKKLRWPVLVVEKGTLPGDEPIAWRETTKKGTGNFSHLFRISVFLLIFAFSPAVLWGILLLCIVAKGATAFASERARQTLDVLLTTPLTGREIVLQKMRGIERLAGAFLVPFFVAFVLKSLTYSFYSRYDRIWHGLFLSLLSLAAYIPLFSWVSLLVGLKVKSRARALLVGLSTMIVLLGTGPLAFLALNGIWPSAATPQIRGLLSETVLATSVATLDPERLSVRSRPSREDRWWSSILANFAVYTAIGLAIRWRCLSKADEYLGRVPEPSRSRKRRDGALLPPGDLEAEEVLTMGA